MNKLLSALIAAAFAGMTLTAVAADVPAAPAAADMKAADGTEKPAKKHHHHKKHKKAAEAKAAETAPAK